MSMMQAIRSEVVPFPRAFRSPAVSGRTSAETAKRDGQMSESPYSTNGRPDDRIAVESIACILRRLVDDGIISAAEARATMVDSLATLAEPGIRTLWEKAIEEFEPRNAAHVTPAATDLAA